MTLFYFTLGNLNQIKLKDRFSLKIKFKMQEFLMSF